MRSPLSAGIKIKWKSSCSIDRISVRAEEYVDEEPRELLTMVSDVSVSDNSTSDRSDSVLASAEKKMDAEHGKAIYLREKNCYGFFVRIKIQGRS